MAVRPPDRFPEPNPYTQAILRLVPNVGTAAAQLRQDLHDREQRRWEQFQSEVADQLSLDELIEAFAQMSASPTCSETQRKLQSADATN